MQIRHERPISDLSYEVRAPLKLTLSDGRTVAINRWSLSSLHFPDPTDIMPKAGTLAIPFQGVEIQFPVRFSQGAEHGELVFTDLTGRQRETLAVFYRSILSGKMASTNDVITSLDTPVDLVPMGETDEEQKQGSQGTSPRLLRILWNVAFYACLAVVVFGLIGSQIYNRLSHVNLQHARVVSPLVELHSTEASYVDRILVSPGMDVKQGDVLVRLSNPDRNSRLQAIRDDIARTEDRVREARADLRKHLNQFELSRAPLLEAHQDAIAKRSLQDFLSDTNMAEVYFTKAALDAFDPGQSRTPGDFYDRRKNLQDALRDRKDALGRLKRDLGIQKAASAAANIVATVDGTITRIDVFRDQFLARGDMVLAIEENQPRVVRAWLNEARSAAVHPGMPVQIRLSDGAGTRSVPGTITDVVASIDPTVSNEFGVIVTAAFDHLDVAKTRTLVRPDAPVSLRAVKNWAADLEWWR